MLQDEAEVITFQLTAREVAEDEIDLTHEYMKRTEFKLAAFSRKAQDLMYEAMIAEKGIKGGWFWWIGLPDSDDPTDYHGPFETQQAALEDSRQTLEE